MAASILMLLFFLFFKKQNISAPDPSINLCRGSRFLGYTAENSHH
jgi:hypothetical protein